jgi:hypothetical protein
VSGVASRSLIFRSVLGGEKVRSRIHQLEQQGSGANVARFEKGRNRDTTKRNSETSGSKLQRGSGCLGVDVF